ncbi:MAG: Fic family protein [Bacilli bacterium]|nr:Fic family protein [Bacilli bacterium]
MEPFKAQKLPHDYDFNTELINLLCEAKEAYGEYKGFLKNMSFDYKFLLESLLINDIYYSCKIDNLKISKEDMFNMPYRVKDNNSIIFNNLKKTFMFSIANSNQKGFNVSLFNGINKNVFLGCKKESGTKGSGHFRKTQTYILKPGLAGSSVSFVPPVYGEISSLMKNLCEYLNDNNDESFIALSLFHFQFERIHPYLNGNGLIGRLLIPVILSYYKNEPPILFLSESMEHFKNTYFTLLSANEEVLPIHFIKFFLQCVIKQCSFNIKKIKQLNKVYKNDYEAFKEVIGGSTIYKVYPIIIKRVVFTTNDIVVDTGLHINSVNKVLNKLVEAGYLIKEKKSHDNRVTFKYKNMYDAFVN